MSSRVYTPPSDEQLERFVAVTAWGPGASRDEAILSTVRALLEAPGVREAWQRRHRKMQEQIWEVEG